MHNSSWDIDFIGIETTILSLEIEIETAVCFPQYQLQYIWYYWHSMSWEEKMKAIEESDTLYTIWNVIWSDRTESLHRIWFR